MTLLSTLDGLWSSLDGLAVGDELRRQDELPDWRERTDEPPRGQCETLNRFLATCQGATVANAGPLPVTV